MFATLLAKMALVRLRSVDQETLTLLKRELKHFNMSVQEWDVPVQPRVKRELVVEDTSGLKLDEETGLWQGQMAPKSE